MSEEEAQICGRKRKHIFLREEELENLLHFVLELTTKPFIHKSKRVILE